MIDVAVTFKQAYKMATWPNSRTCFEFGHIVVGVVLLFLEQVWPPCSCFFERCLFASTWKNCWVSNNVTTPKIRSSLNQSNLGLQRTHKFARNLGQSMFIRNIGTASACEVVLMKAIRGNVFIAASVLLDLNLQGSSMQQLWLDREDLCDTMIPGLACLAGVVTMVIPQI